MSKLIAATNLLQQILERNRDRSAGTLPSWAKPEPMDQLIIALVDGVALSVATDPEETDAPAIVAEFTQLLVVARTDPKARSRRGQTR